MPHTLEPQPLLIKVAYMYQQYKKIQKHMNILSRKKLEMKEQLLSLIKQVGQIFYPG